jgi:hypothetical protein
LSFIALFCLLSLSQESSQVINNNNNNNNTMPPKKKNAQSDDLGMMRAARFGRVKNDLAMGFVGLPNVRLYLFVGFLCFFLWHFLYW